MTSLKSFARFAAVGLAILVGASLPANATSTSGNPNLAGLNITAMRQATVTIFNVSNTTDGRATRSLGSGFLIDNTKCLVVTNHHVIDNAAFLTVHRWDDGERRNPIRAHIVGSPHPVADIAVIQMDSCDGLPVAPLGDSSALNVGDVAIAIGSPLGLTDTVTVGVISNVARYGSGTTVYVQTDTAINSGNSGGPLFNRHGAVIGMNTAIVSRNGGSMGLGLAVPINLVKSVVLQILQTGTPSWSDAGFSVGKLSPSMLRMLGAAHAPGGAIITSVKDDGAASRAGLKTGDVVLSIGGVTITSQAMLNDLLLQKFKAGQTVDVVFVRGRQVQSTQLTFNEAFVTPEKVKAEAYKGAGGMKLLTPKNLYFQTALQSLQQLPPPVIEAMMRRGISIESLAQRIADQKASEMGALANSVLVGGLFNLGPGHEAGMKAMTLQPVMLQLGPGMSIPFVDITSFMAITGVTGETLPYEKVSSAEQLEAYLLRAAAQGERVILEVTLVKASDEDDKEGHTALETGQLFIELTPRLFKEE